MKENLKNAFISRVPLSDNEWEDLSSRWFTMEYNKNDIMCAEGKIEKYFYFVIEGVQRLYFISEEGKEFNLGFSYNNDFSGVYDSFLSQKPSHYYIEALTYSKLLAITFSDYTLMLDRYRSFERWGRLFMQDILMGRMFREREILSCSAEERYQNFLKRSGHCMQFIPQKHLASYLFMSPETLSRIRKSIS